MTKKNALMLAGVLAVTMTSAAARAEIIQYTFSVGSTFGFPPDVVYFITGGFDYDTVTGSASNSTMIQMDGSAFPIPFSFPTATAKSPTDVVFSGQYGAPELFFAHSLADGGIDPITGGAFPGAVVEATGSVIASAAPEPSTWALMFAGVAMLGGMLRRNKPERGTFAGAAVI